jgi:hypothetical protein
MENFLEEAIVLTQDDLLFEKNYTYKDVILSGSFYKKNIWKNLKKLSTVESLSLKFVNQPTFQMENARQDFLTALQDLKNLKALSLENQFFVGEHLAAIPNWVKTLDLSNTTVYGLEALPKGITVKGIEGVQEATIDKNEISLMIEIIIQHIKQFDKKETKILHLKDLNQNILKLIQHIESEVVDFK